MLLLLLQGQAVLLPSPKMTSATAIVASDKSLIANFSKNNVTDTLQNEMMAAPWKVLNFFTKFQKLNRLNYHHAESVSLT